MSRKSRKNVGVIGLGIIGTRVAAGLRAGGYQVYVWNRSAKPAPNFLGSPAEVAESAEIIQIFVADAAALFDVIEAMSESLTPKHIIVCCSTVGPEAVLEAAQAVQSRGAQFLDAPFTGSKLAAERRQLVYYIGGAEANYLRVKPVLEVTSKAIVRMGEIGHASTVKVVTNMISAVTVQVLAEALSIVQKAGLEPEVLSAAIEQNACRSGVIDLKLPKMVSGDYDPHFSLKHMFKDVQLGIHMANALDIEIPVTTVTAGVMYGALNQGWADLDFSALYKNYTPPETTDELPALPAGLVAAGAAPELAESSAEAVAEGLSEINALAPEQAAIPAEPEPAGNDDLPVEERVPTEESAKMIEVVVSHGGIDGPELENRVESPVVEESGGGDEVKPVSENGEPEEKAEGNGENPPEGETEVRPQNFVKRWFVARSGR